MSLSIPRTNMAATMSGSCRSKLLGKYIQNALFCFYRNSSALQPQLEEISQVEYPPVKPKYPPGIWGEMDRKYAWLWYNQMQRMAELSDPQQRIDDLTSKEMKMWRFNVPELYPRQTGYLQYVTKTHMVDDLPEIYKQIETDSLMDKVKKLLVEYLCIENDKLLREVYLSKLSGWKQDFHRSQVMVDAINRSVLQIASHKCEHLADCLVGENVQVNAFWDRYGIERSKRCVHPKKAVFVKVKDSRFQAKYVSDYQIRVEKPLPEFVPIGDSLCVDGDGLKLEYHPRSHGQVMLRTEKPSVIPGHWLGDPCEFGQLSVLLTNQLQQHVRHNEFNPHYVLEFERNLGLGASFVWLVAQAHTQGFNTYLDLTYPFTTQTILTDGQHFTFFAYQLNTLHLWKDNEANPTQNVCWHTDQMKLYDVIENGEVKGFNDDVLRNILKMFVMKPRTNVDNLKPTLPAFDFESEKQTEYISEKKEEIVVEEEEIYM